MAYRLPENLLLAEDDDGYFPDRETVMQNIQAAVSCLAPLGVDVAAFTPEAVSECGLVTRSFVKMCKIFKSCSDSKILSAILDQAVSANVLSGVSTMTVNDCIDLIEWMKSEKGRKTVQGVHKRAKLERKTRQGDSVVETALVHVLQLQIQDYGNKKHGTIKDGRKAIKDKFLRCASGFEGPTNEELDDKCYILYCTDAADNHAIPRPRHDPMSMVIARKKYEGKARDMLMREFVRGEGVKKELVSYLKAKIAYLEENYYLKQAADCRNYLDVIAGGEQGNKQAENDPTISTKDQIHEGRSVGKKRALE